MEELNNLSKKERKSLQRQQKEQQKSNNRQKRKIKKLLIYGSAVLIVGGVISGSVWWASQQEPTPEPVIVSRNGIHWHADLNINILGEAQDIPAGIGLEKLPHKPIHTHDRDNVIHLEFSGVVKEDNLRLGQFFGIWEQEFNKNCIFDKCNGFEGQVKMFVNSEQNYEFENYVMQDGDKIEIIFE